MSMTFGRGILKLAQFHIHESFVAVTRQNEQSPGKIIVTFYKPAKNPDMRQALFWEPALGVVSSYISFVM